MPRYQKAQPREAMYFYPEHGRYMIPDNFYGVLPPKYLFGGKLTGEHLLDLGKGAANFGSSLVGGALGNPDLIPELEYKSGAGFTKALDVADDVAGAMGKIGTQVAGTVLGGPMGGKLVSGVQGAVGQATAPLTAGYNDPNEPGKVVGDVTNQIIGSLTPALGMIGMGYGGTLRKMQMGGIPPQMYGAPDAEVEGGEVIQTPQGVYPQPVGQGTAMPIEGGYEMEGPDHAEYGPGGIPVEMNGDGAFVFSKRLKTKGGKTFAEEAKKLMKKEERAEENIGSLDPYESRSAMFNMLKINKDLENLKSEQEMKKADKEARDFEKEMMAYGGALKRFMKKYGGTLAKMQGGGDLPPVRGGGDPPYKTKKDMPTAQRQIPGWNTRMGTQGFPEFPYNQVEGMSTIPTTGIPYGGPQMRTPRRLPSPEELAKLGMEAQVTVGRDESGRPYMSPQFMRYNKVTGGEGDMTGGYESGSGYSQQFYFEDDYVPPQVAGMRKAISPYLKDVRPGEQAVYTYKQLKDLGMTPQALGQLMYDNPQGYFDPSVPPAKAEDLAYMQQRFFEQNRAYGGALRRLLYGGDPKVMPQNNEALMNAGMQMGDSLLYPSGMPIQSMSRTSSLRKLEAPRRVYGRYDEDTVTSAPNWNTNSTLNSPTLGSTFH